MSRLPWAIAVVAVTFVSAEALGPQARQSDREAVTAAHARWFTGILGRYDVLADVLAPDVTLRFPGGNQASRREFLDLLETKQLSYGSADHHETEVRVYGDAAIVTGRSTLQFRLKGNAGSEHLAYTAVYVRAGGKRSLVAWQSTRRPQ
jgi:ketosteroid isomerase-like protein